MPGMKASGQEQVDALVWSDKDILRIVDDCATSKRQAIDVERG
jgi:hypothetical protein